MTTDYIQMFPFFYRLSFWMVILLCLLNRLEEMLAALLSTFRDTPMWDSLPSIVSTIQEAIVNSTHNMQAQTGEKKCLQLSTAAKELQVRFPDSSRYDLYASIMQMLSFPQSSSMFSSSHCPAFWQIFSMLWIQARLLLSLLLVDCHRPLCWLQKLLYRLEQHFYLLMWWTFKSELSESCKECK